MNRGYNSTFDCVHPKREGRKTNEKTNRHKPFRNVNSATLSHTFTYSSRPGYAHIVKHWIKIIYVYIYISLDSIVFLVIFMLSLSLFLNCYALNCEWWIANGLLLLFFSLWTQQRLSLPVSTVIIIYYFSLSISWRETSLQNVALTFRELDVDHLVFFILCVCFFVCLCAAYKRFELELVDDDDNFVCLISTELYVSPLSAHWRNRQCEKNDNIIIIILNHINRIVA